LDEGSKVRIKMRLKGREHALKDYANKKIRDFFEQINKEKPVKIERELKKSGGELIMIISKK